MAFTRGKVHVRGHGGWDWVECVLHRWFRRHWRLENIPTAIFSQFTVRYRIRINRSRGRWIGVQHEFPGARRLKIGIGLRLVF